MDDLEESPQEGLSEGAEASLGRHKRHWTGEEEDWLLFYFHEGKTVAEIARKLQRSTDAIHHKYERMGIKRRVLPEATIYTTAQTAAILGLTVTTLGAWRRRKIIRAIHLPPDFRNVGYMETEIYRFIRDEYERLDFPVMPNGKFKAFAQDIANKNKLFRYLTPKQAADRKGISTSAIRRAVREGKIKSRWQGRFLFIDPVTLDQWQPDYKRAARVLAYFRQQKRLRKAA